MKRWLLIALGPLTAVGIPWVLTGCGDARVVETNEVADPPPESEAPPVPKKVPAAPVESLAVETEPPAPVASATPVPEYAPPGVFYLVAAARIETDAGIVGLAPGTGVKLVRPGVYLSPHGEVSLRDDQITNDMNLARLAASQDAAQQAVLKQGLEAQARAAAAAQAARDAAAPTTPVPRAHAPVASTTPVRASSLQTGGQNGASSLGATHSNTKDKVYIDSRGYRYWRDAKGRHRYDF